MGRLGFVDGRTVSDDEPKPKAKPKKKPVAKKKPSRKKA